ncbi:Survival motor neuron-like protein 1 [Tolypocladium ophioglossoides CBS 100239]|uniref:Survival motor neuron-like protein 1 n=1 Tax=Tolypocladium ophioglossoides (strain CBS 100239) TaxID=1163406 RepID=A0A0L0NFJ3_TOLOC|nr:Survival motor neuron-like protein 1 [Tolypocladium ophioglossoides CBS 100239]
MRRKRPPTAAQYKTFGLVSFWPACCVLGLDQLRGRYGLRSPWAAVNSSAALASKLTTTTTINCSPRKATSTAIMATEGNRTNHKKIWDDSALVDSWNEALNEYKKYHSVHARGGSVKEIEGDDPSIAAVDDAYRTKGSAPTEAKDDHVDGQPNASGQEEGEEEGEVMSVDENLENASTTGTHDPPPDSGADQVPVTFPPQAIMGSIQDENLKKLLMSWYYAGYYTGLYERQQQQKTEQYPS